MKKNWFIIIVVLLLACSFSAPQATTYKISDVSATPIDTSPLSMFNFTVETNTNNEERPAGEPFPVETDNCGSPTESEETISRSHEEEIVAEFSITPSLIGELGGDIAVINAKVGTELQSHFGIQIGQRQQFEVSRKLITPGYSTSIGSLQFQQQWTVGKILVKQADGTLVGEIPYEALTSLSLKQISMDVMSCTPSPETPRPTKDIPPTPIPTATETKIPTPKPTSTPLPIIIKVSGEETGVEDGSTYGATEKSWTSTGIYVQQGDIVKIKFISGEWWIGKTAQNDGEYDFVPQTPTDAGGYVDREENRVIAEMLAETPEYCEVLRSAPIGALIGKIGEGTPFFVGNNLEFVAQETGILFLRINYNTRKGFAFDYLGDCPKENGGEISVGITVTIP